MSGPYDEFLAAEAARLRQAEREGDPRWPVAAHNGGFSKINLIKALKGKTGYDLLWCKETVDDYMARCEPEFRPEQKPVVEEVDQPYSLEWYTDLKDYLRNFSNCMGEANPYDCNGVAFLMLALVDNLRHNFPDQDTEWFGDCLSDEQAEFFLKLAEAVRNRAPDEED